MRNDNNKMTMTKKITLTLLLVISISLAFNVFSQGRPVEVEYPEVEGYKPEEVTTPVPEYVKYIFNFLIWISGFIAFVVLIIGGFQYATSAGSPERIKDAKDRIGAALLGLLILFGSYLILTTINPELVVFHLKRLRPILSTLPQGVLVCKEGVVKEDEVNRAFQLTIDFPLIQEYEQQKKAKEELDKILDKIALKCYTIPGSGDIMSHFDNKITDIYFIPGIEKGYGVAYGAIIYEETGYKGKSQAFYKHINWVGLPKHYGENDFSIKISSIKCFTTQWQPDPNWQIVLYQETNFNKGVLYLGEEPFWLHKVPCGADELWCDINLPTFFSWSPKSIKIEGDLLAILFTADGRSDTFFSESDFNLEDNLNIVKEVECTDYKKQTKIRDLCIYKGAGFGGGYVPCCAEAAATRLLIISAKPY